MRWSGGRVWGLFGLTFVFKNSKGEIKVKNNFMGNSNRWSKNLGLNLKRTEKVHLKTPNVIFMYWALAYFICDVLCDLVQFVELRKPKKHPWRSVTFSKVGGLACNFTKSNNPPWVFFWFFKLYKWYQIAQNITYCLHTIIWKQVKKSSKIGQEQKTLIFALVQIVSAVGDFPSVC